MCMQSSVTLVNEENRTDIIERTTSFFWRKVAPPFFSLEYECCALVTIWELFKMVSFSYLALVFPSFFLLMLCSLRTNCTAVSFLQEKSNADFKKEIMKLILTTQRIPWGTWSPETSGLNWSGCTCIGTHPSLQGAASPGEFSRGVACPL